jgi:hypothetical protein
MLLDIRKLFAGVPFKFHSLGYHIDMYIAIS